MRNIICFAIQVNKFDKTGSEYDVDLRFMPNILENQPNDIK